MARILAIDYGTKRIGLAVSDPLRIIANALDTVPNGEIFTYLDSYMAREEVDTIIIGYPTHLNGELADVTRDIDEFITKLEQRFSHINIVKRDERYTSKMAFNTMIQSGIGKKARTNKGLIDRISATIILQEYMEYHR